MTKVNQSRIREALTAGTNVKEKGPPVADGILSVTPDTPEMLEWRSRSALDVAETSSTFLDDDDDGPKPHELYGKFTWKIENFSEISKRELRSNVFDVGNYKWYILVYPQGCDVCNHVSLFLCVADYDKLLPGWSHFAQFTIAVVNKDPKKSKYSDTLHRFCKKEHDWGWKKFMELSKVLDGFTVADTLVIKAQVQVILDKPSKPFRCLDPQYRRELVRVYLTNVEGICRRFCEEKKARLGWTRDEALSFRQFWGSLTPEQQRKYLTDKGEVILKAVVKQFFNEKEVTSTLVMDALYSGCKQIEEHSRTWLEGKCSDDAPLVLIKAERNTFTLCGDLMGISDRVQKDFIPAAKDDNKALQPNDGLTLRSGQDGDDYRRDSIERDEKRLAELGRKTIEMFVIAHIFSEKLEIAYREAEALKRQDQLIAEEFEMARLEESKAQAKAQADKERKAKKKEKLKLKKEAEKLRREAEEAERRAREEEARRQEAERKAKEVEKKRLDDAQAQAQGQQQQHGRKAGRGRDDGRGRAQQHQQPAKAKQTAASLSEQQLQQQQQQCQQTQAQQQQQQPVAGPSQPHTEPANRPPATGLPSLSSLAAAVVASSLASSHQPERPDPRDGSYSGSLSCSEEEEEVGTLKQATGAVESSGDAEDDTDVAVASSAAGGAGGTATESDGASDDTDSRAALEEEVAILRAQVVQLNKLLAERDAELFALRAQLAELQPTEIADMVKDGAAASGPGTGSHGVAAAAQARLGCGGAGSSGSSSGSSSVAEGAGPSGTTAAAVITVTLSNGAAVLGPGRDAGPAESSPAVGAAGVGRPEPDRGPRAESAALANGPKDGMRPEVMSPSRAPALSASASAAAAAVRRMHTVPASSGPTSTHDAAAPLLHTSVVPARPASTGPAVAAIASTAAAAAAVQGSGLGLVAMASSQPRPAGLHSGVCEALGQSGTGQQPTAAVTATPSGESHAVTAPGAAMQRSTSATLPAMATGTSASAGAGSYAQLGAHPLTAAAPTANGRSRAGAALDAAAAQGPSTTHAATGGKATFMPRATTNTAATAAAVGSVAATSASANGIGSVLHAPAAQPVQDGLPSYRNAAAGVLTVPGQPASALPSSAAASSLLPMTSPTSTSTTTAGALKDRSTPTAAPSRHMGHSVAVATAADGAFSTNARIMMQAQRAGLAFSTPTAVQSAAAKQRMAASTQLDSPGLEDFAHINMIDDLLTE